MGVEATYLALSASLIAKAAGQPELLDVLLAPGEYTDEGLAGVLPEAAQRSEVVSMPRLELSTAWDGAHFLLTGHPAGAIGVTPLSRAIAGGEYIVEGSSACVISPEHVAESARAMNEIASETLDENFDFVAMSAAQVYTVSPQADREAVKEQFSRAVSELRRFFEVAAARGAAILYWIE